MSKCVSFSTRLTEKCARLFTENNRMYYSLIEMCVCVCVCVCVNVAELELGHLHLHEWHVHSCLGIPCYLNLLFQDSILFCYGFIGMAASSALIHHFLALYLLLTYIYIYIYIFYYFIQLIEEYTSLIKKKRYQYAINRKIHMLSYQKFNCHYTAS